MIGGNKRNSRLRKLKGKNILLWYIVVMCYVFFIIIEWLEEKCLNYNFFFRIKVKEYRFFQYFVLLSNFLGDRILLFDLEVRLKYIIDWNFNVG